MNLIDYLVENNSLEGGQAEVDFNIEKPSVTEKNKEK